jgi:hypothetical protein
MARCWATTSRLKRRQLQPAKRGSLRQQTADGAAGKYCLSVLGAFLPGDRQEGAGGDDAGKNMPIGSGLGSSACSVVAALVAMNEFCGKPLNETRMLALMGEMEGRISGSIHYDNVAPCYLGGMQLMIEENGIISQQVPGLMSGCGCWPIRGLRSPPRKRGRFCRRSIAVRTVSPTVVIWRALFTPATPASRSWRRN